VRLAVIIPAHARSDLLDGCLAALAASDARDFSVLVVDDASNPPIAPVAQRHGFGVLRLDGKPRGPAYARNRGAEACDAPVLVFVDADVRVHPETLSRFARAFEDDPALGAVFGSYDDRPSSPGVVAQFRNLLHHFHHQQGAGEAETFWSGCGAVRAEVFRSAGGFDAARFPRPSVEDIEFGMRIRRSGHRIALRADIQCTHDKAWTLGEMIRVDTFARGIPWIQLLLERKDASRTLNLSLGQRLSVGLLGAAVACFFFVPWSPWSGLAGSAALMVLTAINAPFYRLLVRARGPGFALRALPLHWVYFACCGVAALAGAARYAVARPPARVRAAD